MLLRIIKCWATAGLLRPNLLFLVNSIKMLVRTPYLFTVPPLWKDYVIFECPLLENEAENPYCSF